MASAKWGLVIASLLDLTAFSLAFLAEFNRSTAVVAVDDSLTYNYCIYSSKIATFYSVCALLCLIAGQFLKGIYRFKGNPHCSSFCAVLLYVVSWVSFVEAVVLLVIGSVINAKRTNFRSIHTDDLPLPFCETLRKGVFGAGAALIFVMALTFNIYYIFHFKARGSCVLDVNDTSDNDDLKKNFVAES